ncbi:MAG: PAS domain S-box protein [Methylovulum sp.]|nr:PAS domain S-box protein [Methylovulum sp.]
MQDKDNKRQQAEATVLLSVTPSPDDMQRVIQELHTHQAELEAQNEELRRMHQELDAARARYFDLYDLAPLGYCTLDEQGLILEANLTAAKLLGVERSELLKREITRFIIKEDQDIYYLHQKQRLQAGEQQSCVLRMLKNDGVQFWGYLVTSPMQNGDAEVVRIVLTDVTEREQAKLAALQASVVFSQAILNSVSVEIAVIDRTGVILAVNEAWRRFALDYSGYCCMPGSNIGVGTNYLGVCSDTHPAHAGIQAVLDGRLPCFNFEYPCHTPQHQYWFSMSVTPLGEAAQQGAVIAHENITGRKQAGEAQRIAAIAFECQEGIVIMDADLNILRVNQAFMAITGYAQQDVQGKKTAMFRSGRQPDAYFDGVWREVMRNSAWQGDMWLRRKNGEEYPGRVTITAVKDEAGRTSHYVGTITDATNKELQEQQRLLNELQHRNILVREVHHRIKNNLQGITGILRQFAQKHPETTEVINQAIGQVQGISVIHGLQGRAVTSSVRVCELTVAIAAEVEALWQKPVAVNIPVDWVPCIISEAEAVPLALVLNELVINAVKHGGAGGLVNIMLSHEPRPGSIRLAIHNTGAIPASFGLEAAGSLGVGLQLVASLLPQAGATLFWTQQGHTVVTTLSLDAPIIQQEPKT